MTVKAVLLALMVALTAPGSASAAGDVPPPNTALRRYPIGGWDVQCELILPAGTLANCRLLARDPFLWITIQQYGGAIHYAMNHACVLGRGIDTHLYRDGIITGVSLAGSKFASDLAELNALPVRPDCTTHKSKPATFLDETEAALAMLRSL